MTPTAPDSQPLAAASIAPPRRQRRHQQPGPQWSTRTWGILLGTLAGSASLAVWLSQQTLPRVTHAEAMAMALNIEGANDMAALQPLVRFEAPPAVALQDLGIAPAGPAAAILQWKQGKQYTFIGTRTGAEGPRLLFRCRTEGSLVDYHELRLERFDDKVLISDLWSMAMGGWLSTLLAERARLAAMADFAPVMASVQAAKDGASQDAAWRAVPKAYRHSATLHVGYLQSLRPEVDLARLRAAIDEARTAVPDSLAPDLLVVTTATTPAFRAGMRPDVPAAIARMNARVADDDFLNQILTQLMQ